MIHRAPPLRLAPRVCRLCGYSPFYDENMAVMFQRIKVGDLGTPSEEWLALSPEGQAPLHIQMYLLIPTNVCVWGRDPASRCRWV